MKVTIVSIQAAIAGRDEITWTGEIEMELGLSDDQTNDVLFRFFNRVDDDDHERLEALGYRLPSLSVGDLVHWNLAAYRVAGLGFERITGSENYVSALALYALRTASEGLPT